MGYEFNMWPRRGVIRLHKEMWNSIADNIEKCKCVIDIKEAKSDFCSKNGFSIKCDCFLCEYSKDILCRDCPVVWGNNTLDTCISLLGGRLGLYRKVKNASSWEEQAALARQIANSPEREV